MTQYFKPFRRDFLAVVGVYRFLTKVPTLHRFRTFLRNPSVSNDLLNYCMGQQKPGT